jgi:hypothetical protein
MLRYSASPLFAAGGLAPMVPALVSTTAPNPSKTAVETGTQVAT